MKMVPCDIKDVERLGFYKTTKNRQLIDDFVNSAHDCVRLEGWLNTDAGSCASSLNQTIKKLRKDHQIKAFSRNGEVYLVKISGRYPWYSNK